MNKPSLPTTFLSSVEALSVDLLEALLPTKWWNRLENGEATWMCIPARSCLAAMFTVIL